MDRIDLHTHTTCSDGTCTPGELVAAAQAAGLAAVAITDHDTLAGWAEAGAAARRLGIEWIPGCEITARMPAGTVHVLAYAMDPGNGPFQDLLARIRVGRDARNAAILERLRRLGVPLTREEVQAAASSPLVARPHIAAALVARGHVESIREAFERFLRDGGPAYVPAEAPSPAEAIEATVGAGGVAAIAHPRQIKLGSRARQRRVFARWREAGLAGIEVHHPSHDATHRQWFAELADELDLVPTGGSDYHGLHKPYLRLGEGDGSIDVRYATWERLRARRSG